MLTEDYVSFETAKLLREKGFDGNCDYIYDSDGYFYRNDCGYINDEKPNEYFYALAPTHSMAMKYLREVHDLHIIVYPWKADREERATHWCCQVYKSFNLLGYEKYTNETPKSYEEACEIALKYCLTNLI